jgi:hypothetical protein
MRYSPPKDASAPGAGKLEIASGARERFRERKKARREETGRGYILAVAIIEAVLACLLLYVRLTLWDPDPRIPKPAPHTMRLMELGLTVLVCVEFGLAVFYLALWLLARRWVLGSLITTLCLNVLLLVLRSVVLLRGFMGCWVAVGNLIVIMGLITGIRSHLRQQKKEQAKEAEGGVDADGEQPPPPVAELMDEPPADPGEEH